MATCQTEIINKDYKGFVVGATKSTALFGIITMMEYRAECPARKLYLVERVAYNSFDRPGFSEECAMRDIFNDVDYAIRFDVNFSEVHPSKYDPIIRQHMAKAMRNDRSSSAGYELTFVHEKCKYLEN
jgi:hypothetical protein